jgi:DNA modification methylase
MQRSKALGLLHKQIVKDSSLCIQGTPDYLITFRKPGDNGKPITHKPNGFQSYIGEQTPKAPKHPVAAKNKFSHEVWQRYASPVWTDISQSKTLQYRAAREQNDERHIAPLQLQVVERALELWSRPNDLVLSPFMGIGTEGYVSLKMGRRFIGVELKPSYWSMAVKNLKYAETHSQIKRLF